MSGVVDVEQVPAILRKHAATLFARVMNAHFEVRRLASDVETLMSAVGLLAGEDEYDRMGDDDTSLSEKVGATASFLLLLDLAAVIGDVTRSVSDPMDFDLFHSPRDLWPATGWPLPPDRVPLPVTHENLARHPS